MQTIQAAHWGADAWSISYARNAPSAPTAPKARYSTPVARYRTTSPTPDRAYTPPRARPLTRNCSSSAQLGISVIGHVDVGSAGAVPAWLRYCAICGSTAEIGVQVPLGAIVICPLLGVTV